MRERPDPQKKKTERKGRERDKENEQEKEKEEREGGQGPPHSATGKTAINNLHHLSLCAPLDHSTNSTRNLRQKHTHTLTHMQGHCSHTHTVTKEVHACKELH